MMGCLVDVLFRAGALFAVLAAFFAVLAVFFATGFEGERVGRVAFFFALLFFAAIGCLRARMLPLRNGPSRATVLRSP
jgi:hypothetical protein